MKKHLLNAKPRDIVGRKVKNLRKAGFIPATVYGKKIKSVSVSVPAETFSKVYKEAGETGLIDLSLDSEIRPVLVDSVQIDPVTSEALHIEFHQVDLKEKVTAQVPLEITGEPPAVTQKLGVLLSVLDEVEVEALPTDLPEHISVDVSHLEQVNDEIKVSNLDIPKGVTVKTDPALTIVKIGSLITKEAEQQAAEEEAAQAAAKAAEAPEAPAAEEAPTAPAEQPAAPAEKEQPKSP